MRIRIISFVFSFVLIGSLSGQELINISNTLYLHNPAVTGMKADVNFTGQYFGLSRINNLSFNNSRFFLDGRVPSIKDTSQLNLAIGFAYERDKIGALTENNWSFSLANHFQFRSNAKISVGISATQIRRFYDNLGFVFPNGGPIDPVFFTNPKISNRYSAGGIYESSDKTFIWGLAGSYATANQSGLYRLNASIGKAIEFGKNFAVSINTFNEFVFVNKTWLLEVPVKIHFKKSLFVGSTFAFDQYLGIIAGGRIKHDKMGVFEIGGGYFALLSPLTNRPGYGVNMYLNYYFTNPDKKEAFSYF